MRSVLEWVVQIVGASRHSVQMKHGVGGVVVVRFVGPCSYEVVDGPVVIVHVIRHCIS